MGLLMADGSVRNSTGLQITAEVHGEVGRIEQELWEKELYFLALPCQVAESPMIMRVLETAGAHKGKAFWARLLEFSLNGLENVAG